MERSQVSEVRVTGGSMAPFVPPGSRVRVTRIPVDQLKKGDVVCYLGENKQVIAHRLMRKVGFASRMVLFVKGDANDFEEEVPREAVVSVVRRVEHPLLSYDTDGPIGRAAARVALAEDVKTRLAKLFLRSAWKAWGRLRRAHRRGVRPIP